MFTGFVEILVFWLIGESLAFVLNLSINGAVLGMLLFFLFLMWQKGINRKTAKMGDLLIKSLPLLLLPGSVAIFFLGDIMQGKWLILLFVIFASSIITIIFTLYCMQKILQFIDYKKRKKNQC